MADSRPLASGGGSHHAGHALLDIVVAVKDDSALRPQGNALVQGIALVQRITPIQENTAIRPVVAGALRHEIQQTRQRPLERETHSRRIG